MENFFNKKKSIEREENLDEDFNLLNKEIKDAKFSVICNKKELESYNFQVNHIIEYINELCSVIENKKILINNDDIIKLDNIINKILKMFHR